MAKRNKARSNVLKLLRALSKKQHHENACAISQESFCQNATLSDKRFWSSEVLFRSHKSKTNICPFCRVVDDTAHFLFSRVSYQEHRKNFIDLQNQNVEETLVGLLNCENKHGINALAGFIASIE